jgi:hypothetical protein
MTDVDYVMSVRALKKGDFISDVGSTQLLRVPLDSDASQSQAGPAAAWYSEVRTAGSWKC